MVGAECERINDPSEKVNTFCVRVTDGSEYLFSAPTVRKMEIWIQTIDGKTDEPVIKRDESAHSAVKEFPRTFSFEPESNGQTFSASRVYITSEKTDFYSPKLVETDEPKEKHKKSVFKKFFKK